MGSKKYYYYLVWKDLEIPLFESQFRFLREDQCLRHYEKGIADGIFDFNRAGNDQVWSELALWGLIGRIQPVELVRVLCAFGCEIGLKSNVLRPAILKKSYWPVSYIIPVDQVAMKAIYDLYHISLGQGSDLRIPAFLSLDKRLVVGSYYVTEFQDADFQFPRYCKILEMDLCLPPGTVRDSLFRLLCRGYKIVAQLRNKSIVLAERNISTNVLRGSGSDQALFFIGSR